jgi:hypothetical protein
MKEYTNITELIGFFKKRFTNLTKVMKKKTKECLCKREGEARKDTCAKRHHILDLSLEEGETMSHEPN